MKGTTFKSSNKSLYFVISSICLFLFVLCDLLKINNFSGEWIFFTGGNLLNVIYQISINAIIAFGMAFAIIIGGIDLSVGSVVALSGVVLSIFMVNFGLPTLFSFLIVLLMGALVGVLNGYLISTFNIPAFVVTLGTMAFFRGVSLILVNGTPIFNDNSAFLFIGNGDILSIPFPVIILLVLFGVCHYILKYTRFGRFAYAVGGNEEAARISGINVKRVKMLIHCLCSIVATVSGVILASRLGSGQPLAGEGYELDAITAVIIGGASLNGGIGTIDGVLLGSIVLGLINNGMNLLSISPYFQWIIKGALILTVVVFKQSLMES